MKVSVYNPQTTDQTGPYVQGKFNVADGIELKESINALYDEVSEIPAGADGLSAYQVAVNAGFNGTVNQWLASLKGIDGQSAYQLAVAGGFVGTQAQWLASLKGDTGLSAYQIAVAGGYVGTINQWVTSLKGVGGDSAYQIAVSGGYVGSVTQWVASLKGAAGDSAYIVALANGFVGTQAQWLASLKGSQGDPGVSLSKTYLIPANVANNTITPLAAYAIALKANTKYKIDWHLKLGCDGTGGTRIQFTTPPSSAYSIHTTGNSTGPTALSVSTHTADATVSSAFGGIVRTEAQAMMVDCRGTIETTLSGSIVLNIYPVTAGQTSTLWRLGSFFNIEEIV